MGRARPIHKKAAACTKKGTRSSQTIPYGHQWLSPPSSLFLPTTRHIIITRPAQHAYKYTRFPEEAANSSMPKKTWKRRSQHG
jgi:hypothetical protein